MQNNWNSKARISKEQSMNWEEKAICNNKSLIKLKSYMMMREEKLCQTKKQWNKSVEIIKTFKIN
jgi:hypothetical protein